jgi:obg-like ATPase 1
LHKRRGTAAVISPLPSLTTPPARPLHLLFSSVIPNFFRPAASTASNIEFSASSILPTFRISLTTVRTYAKKKMPPKKVVKEEKVLLGRPGNSLKSGIVSTRPISQAGITFSR